MHPTLSEVNLKTSLKLFFNQKFTVEKSIPIVYDKAVSEPYISSNNMIEITTQWISILFRNTDKDDVSELVVEIFCCVRKDADSVIMERLVDEVNDVLFPENGHLTIPFYDIQTETKIGEIFFLKKLYGQSGSFTAIDGTNYSIFSVPLKWVAVI